MSQCVHRAYTHVHIFPSQITPVSSYFFGFLFVLFSFLPFSISVVNHNTSHVHIMGWSILHNTNNICPVPKQRQVLCHTPQKKLSYSTCPERMQIPISSQPFNDYDGDLFAFYGRCNLSVVHLCVCLGA